MSGNFCIKSRNIHVLDRFVTNKRIQLFEEHNQPIVCMPSGGGNILGAGGGELGAVLDLLLNVCLNMAPWPIISTWPA